MRHQHLGLPPASPACAAFKDLLPLAAHNLLAPEDVERLNEHVASCAYCEAQLAFYDELDALLRSHARVFARSKPTLEETMSYIEDQQNPLPPPPPAPTPVRVTSRHSRTLTVVGTIAAILVVALLAQALLSHWPQQTQIGSSVTPDATANHDSDFGRDWLNQVTNPPVAKYHTPQQAYKAIGPAKMCAHSATIDQTETWLATSSILGVLLVQAHCADGRAPVAMTDFVRVSDNPGPCTDWSAPQGSYYVSRPVPGEALPVTIAATVPSWLALPSDQYQNADFGAIGSPDLSIRFGSTVWLSATNVFAATRFKGEAVIPAHAFSTKIGVRAGWYTTEQGMTTVVVQLDGQEAFTFVGSGSVSETLEQATQALAHLDSLQPRMYDPGHSDVLACH